MLNSELRKGDEGGEKPQSSLDRDRRRSIAVVEHAVKIPFHLSGVVQKEAATMDEEPPVTLAMQVYKGPNSIPHVPGDFFAAFFLATNTALLAHMFPGKVLGSELRPRKFDPDYIASCCNEAGMRRDAAFGKKPEYWLLGGGPRAVTDSWEHRWWDNLHWKRWKVPRMGPAMPQDMYWQ